MRNLFRIEINNNRVFGLDVLRAFAILGVVTIHGIELLPERVENVLIKYLFFDWVGMFFVLSGFLVGGILIREIEQKGLTKATLFNFWKRRWFRTLPAYFLVLVLLIVIQIVYNPAFSIKSVWKYPFFLQNFSSPIPLFFTESWSLGIEEWFYLIIPIIILFLLKTGKITLKQAIIIVSLLVILFCTIMRLYRFYIFSTHRDFPTYIFNLRLQVITRLDGVMFGVLGAFCNHYYRARFEKYAKTMVCFSFLLWIFTGYSRRFYPENVEIYVGSIYWWVIDFTVVSIATLLLIPFLNSWKISKGILYKFITIVSIISYSMYLVNASLVQGYVLAILIPWNSYFESASLIIAFKFVLYWFLVFFLSILLYKYFELPMMKLRENGRINSLLKFNKR